MQGKIGFKKNRQSTKQQTTHVSYTHTTSRKNKYPLKLQILEKFISCIELFLNLSIFASFF